MHFLDGNLLIDRMLGSSWQTTGRIQRSFLHHSDVEVATLCRLEPPPRPAMLCVRVNSGPDASEHPSVGRRVVYAFGTGTVPTEITMQMDAALVSALL